MGDTESVAYVTDNILGPIMRNVTIFICQINVIILLNLFQAIDRSNMKRIKIKPFSTQNMAFLQAPMCGINIINNLGVGFFINRLAWLYKLTNC